MTGMDWNVPTTLEFASSDSNYRYCKKSHQEPPRGVAIGKEREGKEKFRPSSPEVSSTSSSCEEPWEALRSTFTLALAFFGFALCFSVAWSE